MSVFYVARSSGKVIGKFTDGEFKAKIRMGDFSPGDQYLAEGMKQWVPCSSPAFAEPERLRLQQKAKKKERSLAATGGLCAAVAVFISLVHPVLFVFTSLPFLITGFVLAILSIVRGKIAGGLCLLAGTIIALCLSFVAVTDRDHILHHPEKFRSGVTR
jgi:hypothetical protein